MQIDWFLVALAIVFAVVGGYGILILVNDRRTKRGSSNRPSTGAENRTVSH